MRGLGRGGQWARRRGWIRPLLAVALVIAVALARILANHGTSTEPGSGPSALVTGPPQTVFDWSSEACAPDELPDLPVRAFRDYRGMVNLILPHFNSWLLTGPDLDHLRNTCRVAMGSSLDPNPADFNQKEWIASLYTSDGRKVAALVHEEYHGTLRGSCVYTDPTSCWYNAVTYAASLDGGRSFQQPPVPGQLIAASSYRYRPGVDPAGVFSPSNIVRGAEDGLDYAMVVSRMPTGQTGTCLIRTANPFDPSAWRAWDGAGFALRFLDPYRTVGAGPSCTPVATPQIAVMHESLTYNTYLGRYLLVGLASAPRPGTGKLVTGIYFSISSDLVHWSPRRLLMAAPTLQTFRCGGPNPIAYPSLIDPTSASRTFATTDRRPYLYYTRFNYDRCRQNLNRDLLRVPIELSK
jgi:hypothetical protein